MARLRLFANLREAAGVSTLDVDGATVGDVLDAAVVQFGPDFAQGLTVANVWVNGDGADRDTTVSSADEVAVIPPVSGGAAPVVVPQAQNDATSALLGVILLVTFAIANIVSLEALAFAAVGGALAWLWDMGDTLAERGIEAPVIPALIVAAVAGNGAYAWDIEGLAVAVALGLVLVLGWAVFDGRYRRLRSISAGVLMALTAALGVGSLVLIRAISPVHITSFLIYMALGSVAAWAARRFIPGDVGGIDPNIAATAGVLIGAVAVGLLADTVSPVMALITGAAAIAGLFAGRAVGSMLRSGDVAHTTRGPGLLTAIDGSVLAAATFWASLLLF